MCYTIYTMLQGINEVDEIYQIGERNADVVLEVLNLDKKEKVSIDAILNQEFIEVLKIQSSSAS